MIDVILAFFKSNLAKTFLAEYIASNILNSSFKIVRKKLSESELEGQLIDCLEKALTNTCNYFGWEYDSDAITETFLLTWNSIESIDSKSVLQKVLENAIGNSINNEVLNYWAFQFYREASKQEHNWLSTFILLNRSHDQKPSQVTVFPLFITDGPSDVTIKYKPQSVDVEFTLNQLLYYKQSLLLFGLGGIGKTELAKYITKLIVSTPSDNSGIEYVAWIQYHGNFKSALTASLYETRNIRNTDVAWEKARDIIYLHRDKLLIIVDNIETNEDKTLQQLNDLPCRLIVTSRIKNIASLPSYEVKELSPNLCRELFYDYYCGEHNDKILEDILMLIDYHTITIELLAKTADVEGYELDKLLELLIENGINFSNEKVESNHPALDKESKIIEHLMVLFSLIHCSDEIRKVLIYISTFPSIDFTYDIAKKYFNVAQKSDLVKLEKLGWIICSNTFPRTYWMHSVIASSIRAQNADNLYLNCSPIIRKICNELVNSGLEPYESRKLVQLSWALSDVFRKDIEKENDTSFLQNLAKLFSLIGNYQFAVKILEQANMMLNDSLLENDFATVDLRAELAQAYSRIGLYNDALLLYTECLKLLEVIDEKTLRYKAVLYNNIGSLYRLIGMQEEEKGDLSAALNNWQKGIACYNNCISLRSKVKNSEKSLSSDYNNLGSIYKAMKIYYLSLSYHRRSLEIRKRLKDQLLIATSYNNIGVVLREMKAYQKAKEYYDKSYKIRAENLGEDHIDTTLVQYNIGVIFSDMGQHREAMNLFLRVAKIIKKAMGTRHIYYIKAIDQLRKSYIQCGGDCFDDWLKSVELAFTSHGTNQF